MKNEKLPPLEEGLLQAMQAIDKQVEREVGRRTPEETEEHGVQKWEPHDRRIERVCSYALSLLGDNEVQLDSIVVLAQAMVKALQVVADDLGPEGLGKVRCAYLQSALEKVGRYAYLGEQALNPGGRIN